MPEVTRIERLVKRVGQVLTIDASASVASAATSMKADHVGCLVVVDGRKIVGILTERDIVEQVVAASADPAAIAVRHIMTEHVISCPTTAPVKEAQRVMAAHGIRHLPVVDHGVPVGMVSSRDILAHELRVANVRLAAASKAAQEAVKAKSELLTNVSHEIRTPMSGLVGMTEQAMDTSLTPEQRGCLGVVRDSAESLLGMIDDLLDFSGMEAGRVELQETEFDLRESVVAMIGALRDEAENKGLDLTCEIAPDVPDRVVGDPERLSQVLMNITNNAVAFTDSGDVAVRIETEEWFENQVLLHFSVADTGVGISPDKQQVIFEAFRHAEDACARTRRGMGLGLAISAHLVELMQGRIWVESEPGMGSNVHFTVRLRLQVQQAPDERVTQHAGE